MKQLTENEKKVLKRKEEDAEELIEMVNEAMDAEIEKDTAPNKPYI